MESYSSSRTKASVNISALSYENVLIVQDDPAANALSRRPPMATYDCEAANDAIKDRMKSCNDDHTNCLKVEDKILPKRLLDVGSDNVEPHLILPEPETVRRYCALSYCWGQSQPVLLTEKRLQSGLLTYPLQSLLATLKDAVVICRKLGSKFLWVDALCIVQDLVGAEDWKSESAVMDEIYGNAALTLAASAAKDTSQGIFYFPGKGESAGCIPYRMRNGVVSIQKSRL